MNETVVRRLASAVDAYQRCIKTENSEWTGRHEEMIRELLDHLPSGSGWDCGTKIDLDRSTGEKLVLYGSFHHMNEGGMYDGWTEHEIWVRPSLRFGIDLRITGQNRNDVKEYLHETFHWALLEVLLESGEDKAVADAGG